MNKQQIVLVAVGLLGIAVVAAYALTQFAQNDTPRSGYEGRLPAVPEPVETSEPEGEFVSVYFARDEEGVAEVYPLDRETEDTNDFLFAMEELVRGPSAGELAEGYISELQFSPEVSSVCEDRNFSIVAESGIFVVWLCRPIINNDSEISRTRAFNQVDATMRQFSVVDDVVVLDPERDCFADEAGENACFASLPAGVSP